AQTNQRLVGGTKRHGANCPSRSASVALTFRSTRFPGPPRPPSITEQRRGRSPTFLRAMHIPTLLKRHPIAVVVTLLVALPVFIFTVWAGATLHYTYSTGERAGFLQKISRRGWFCKTWEGQIQLSALPGATPEVFDFSTRSDSIAHELNRLNGQRVVLDYEQHKAFRAPASATRSTTSSACAWPDPSRILAESSARARPARAPTWAFAALGPRGAASCARIRRRPSARSRCRRASRCSPAPAPIPRHRGTGDGCGARRTRRRRAPACSPGGSRGGSGSAGSRRR